MSHRAFAGIAAVVFLTFLATGGLIADDWNIEIKKDPADATKVVVQIKGAAPTATDLPATKLTTTIAVECTPPVDCTAVTMADTSAPAGQQSIPLQTDGVTPASQKLTGSTSSQATKGGDTIVVTHSLGKGTFKVAGTAVVEKPPATEPTVVVDKPLAELLQTRCIPTNPGARYDRERDTAIFFVSPLGNTFYGPEEAVDENDTVTVTVFADKRLIPLLRVRRKSAIRDVNAISILGSDLKVPVTQLARESLKPEDMCGQFSVELKDFARGRGEVEIVAQAGERQVPVGSFELAVDALYDGMFSLGAINSSLTDRTFALTAQGDKKIIYAQQEGKTTLYAVMYTPFVWGARDIKKPTKRSIEHLNPVFGFTVTEAGKHAIAGISLDYGGFVLSAGEHFSRDTVLSKSSGLNEGSVFTGDAAAIPTAKKWEQGSFVGFSIDLRAAVLLLKTIAP